MAHRGHSLEKDSSDALVHNREQNRFLTTSDDDDEYWQKEESIIDKVKTWSKQIHSSPSTSHVVNYWVPPLKMLRGAKYLRPYDTQEQKAEFERENNPKDASTLSNPVKLHENPGTFNLPEKLKTYHYDSELPNETQPAPVPSSKPPVTSDWGPAPKPLPSGAKNVKALDYHLPLKDDKPEDKSDPLEIPPPIPTPPSHISLSIDLPSSPPEFKLATEEKVKNPNDKHTGYKHRGHIHPLYRNKHHDHIMLRGPPLRRKLLNDANSLDRIRNKPVQQAEIKETVEEQLYRIGRINSKALDEYLHRNDQSQKETIKSPVKKGISVAKAQQLEKEYYLPKLDPKLEEEFTQWSQQLHKIGRLRIEPKTVDTYRGSNHLSQTGKPLTVADMTQMQAAGSTTGVDKQNERPQIEDKATKRLQTASKKASTVGKGVVVVSKLKKTPLPFSEKPNEDAESRARQLEIEKLLLESSAATIKDKKRLVSQKSIVASLTPLMLAKKKVNPWLKQMKYNYRINQLAKESSKKTIEPKSGPDEADNKQSQLRPFPPTLPQPKGFDRDYFNKLPKYFTDAGKPKTSVNRDWETSIRRLPIPPNKRQAKQSTTISSGSKYPSTLATAKFLPFGPRNNNNSVIGQQQQKQVFTNYDEETPEWVRQIRPPFILKYDVMSPKPPPKITTIEDRSSDNSPLVMNIRLSNYGTSFALLDTALSFSLITIELTQRLKMDKLITPESGLHVIYGLSPMIDPIKYPDVLGVIRDVPIRVGAARPIKMNLYVVEDAQCDCVLGVDFVRISKAVINMHHNIIGFDGGHVKVHFLKPNQVQLMGSRTARHLRIFTP